MTGKTGGPAFPDPAPREDGWSGMTLRDYFAGQALIGLARSSAEQTVDDYGPGHVASDAYSFADAMLAEREKRG